MQLILVDNRIKDVQTVTQSLLPSVDCVSVDFKNDTYDTLIAKIPVKTYDSVGIFQENYELNKYQFIRSFPNSVLRNVEAKDPNLETWSQYKLLLSYFKNTLQIKTLDLMGCNIHSSRDWNYVIDYLGKHFQITINSSNDNTGSPKFDGNWILESGNVNLVGKYFSNNIDKYQFTLGQSSSHNVILKNDGTVYAVGSNWSGQLGNGTTADETVYPVQVLASANVPLTDVVQVSYGADHTVFLLSNGTVYAVGYNEYGQLGNGTTTSALYPVQVLASDNVPLTDVVQVSCGEGHTVFLLSNGQVYAVGANWSGQLGNGTTADETVYPVQVLASDNVPLTDVVQVSCGSEHTVFFKNDGTVYAVGGNWSGQLGNGTADDSLYPVQVLASANVSLTGVVQVSGGSYHTVFLLNDGTVYAVGYNWSGQLGNGTNTRALYPVQVLASANVPLTDVVQVSGGANHTVFFKNDGTVYAVGANWSGQLGNETTTRAFYPVQVLASANVPVTDVVQVSCGSNHTVFLLNTGTVYAVGANWNGQLGNGTTDDSVYPVQVLASSGTSLICGYLITEYNSYYYKNKSTITNTNLDELSYSLLDYLMIGLTPTELKSSPYNYTDSSFYDQSVVSVLITNEYYTVSELLLGGVTVQQMYAGGVTPAQMLAGGVTPAQLLAGGITPAQLLAGGITPAQLLAGDVTIQQMYAGGVTVQQMYAGGVTVQQMLAGGVTIQQMYAGGIIPAQMIADGITLQQMLDGGITTAQILSYNIFESTNTLTYDTNAASTTLAEEESGDVYNIHLTGKNFKYYDLTTNSYTDYDTLCISNSGWLGFSSSIDNYSYGTNVQLPLNTLRFLSFDAQSTIQYYFDSINNLFISTIGSYYDDYTILPFTIVIKVTPEGLIQVHYQSIGTSTMSYVKPIIGWTGNDSSVSTDDIIYSTFNGTSEFVQSNINGKFLNFDFTGLNVYMTANVPSEDIYTYTNSYGFTTEFIENIINVLFPPPPPAAPTISSVNATSLTYVDPTISISVADPSNSSIKNYSWSIDGINYNVLKPLQTTSPLIIPATELTSETEYTFTIMAINVTGTSEPSTGVSATVIIPTPPAIPAAPTISSVNATSLTYVDPTISISVADPSDSSITNYSWSIDGINYTVLNPAQTTSPLIIPATELTSGTEYTFTIMAINVTGTSEPSAGVSATVIIPTPPPPPAAPTISSVNATSLTRVNPTISISVADPSDSTITNYSWSIDGTNYTVLNPAQATSPLIIPATELTSETEYTFQIKAINVTGTSDASDGVSATFILPPPPPAAPTISSVNATSLTRVNPTITISVADPDPSDSTITNYSWSIDGTNYTVLSPAQTTSPLTISASGLTSGSNYTFRIKAINASGTSDASDGVSARFTMPPAAPIVTNITSTQGVTSISFQTPSDASIANYAYSTISVLDIDNFVLEPFSSYTLLSPAQTSGPLTISGLHGVVQIKIKALNVDGLYSDESTPLENWYKPPFV